ncbi:TapB family protein [Spongiivirga citrea]|uniref:DUF3108 domain-containing protein n=1 Tax=Spongiivirga citrea TaxID=1481457 RepID=A0A6M0CL53_9FLAO|nr:hypothetical protein [Spongiivirga citrea]NER18685.1 hypothetical protein [Spongiivirga citrea]
MKFKHVIACIFCLLLVVTAFAQDCDNALFLKEGNALVYNSYNKKGKALNQTIHTTKFIDIQNDWREATIDAEVISVSNDDTFITEYKASCENGLIGIEMARFFNGATLAKYNPDDFVISMDGDVLEFPSELEEGSNLNDGSFSAEIANQTATFITITFEITNRKVANKETITTKAGTFDCQKITYNYSTKAGIKVQGSGADWYTENRILVRSESYNRKGKLQGYTELIEIKE